MKKTGGGEKTFEYDEGTFHCNQWIFFAVRKMGFSEQEKKIVTVNLT